MNKKILSLLLAGAMVFGLAACSNDAQQDTESPAGNSQAVSGAPASSAPGAGEANVAVFYYNYSDAFTASVRAELDAVLDSAGITYQDYDSNGSQATQNE